MEDDPLDELLERVPNHREHYIEPPTPYEEFIYHLSDRRNLGAALSGAALAYLGAYGLSTTITDSPGWQAGITLAAGTIIAIPAYIGGAMLQAARQEYRQALREQQASSTPYQEAILHEGIPLKRFGPRALMNIGEGPAAKQALIRTPLEEELLVVDRRAAQLLDQANPGTRDWVYVKPTNRLPAHAIDELIGRKLLRPAANGLLRTGEHYERSSTVALRFAPIGVRKAYYHGLGNTKNDQD